MTTLITTLQLLTFTLYVGIVWYRYGVLEAISQSTYKWEGERKWYFLLCLGTLGILNLFQGMEVYGFFASAGLFFCGITVDYKENLAYGWYVHTIGVVTAIFLTFIGLWVMYDLWWLLPFYLIISMSIIVDPFQTADRTKVWWIEILGFILIIFGYYIR